MKKTAKQIGNLGEELAEKYLKKRFWRILSRNFNVRGGEIDIIAYRFGVLAFFEVKARSNDLYGRPSDAVDGEKLKHIRIAARSFCSAYCGGGRVSVGYPLGIQRKRPIRKKRVDVIEVYLTENTSDHKINHIKDWENKL